jgi:heme/copper-type cytochrome/quinol oxidase subunit 4
MEEHAGRHSSTGEGPGVDEHEPHGSLATYTVGLAFALLLTAASFIVSQTNLL